LKRRELMIRWLGEIWHPWSAISRTPSHIQLSKKRRQSCCSCRL